MNTFGSPTELAGDTALNPVPLSLEERDITLFRSLMNIMKRPLLGRSDMNTIFTEKVEKHYASYTYEDLVREADRMMDLLVKRYKNCRQWRDLRMCSYRIKESYVRMRVIRGYLHKMVGTQKLENKNNKCGVCLEDNIKSPVFCLCCRRAVGCMDCIEKYKEFLKDPKRYHRCLNCQRLSPRKETFLVYEDPENSGSYHLC